MARILYLTQIDIDPGVVRLLPECERTGMRRPLVVTDAGVRAAGVLQMALDALGEVPHAVFDGTPSNPTEAAVRAAVAVLPARSAATA
jgi:4-hydroxybutyrate dehydrogenase